ncbi:DivIVA domain-containing protein [Actinoplanes octamycinicus]|uniref:DivIVA domain-containing protein n=1 Tax=Actinoplanes octamycinicus TaxID=135948 RepID=A0A7W7MA52_9ACTN|nr:DivIVA domain-containing protein [Actinoplanes octamycinicus]MBB4742485.1 DivIVA domain-containing protein [Actinoplanes octamycinicus]GIE60823.1 hypothetical protein Aoc01nite_62250 [Actinoplanes octamycinicus]
MANDFTVVLRGYDRGEVDRAIAQAEQALDSGSEFSRAAARDTLAAATFMVRLRGYDRAQVEAHVNRLRQALSQAP